MTKTALLLENIHPSAVEVLEDAGYTVEQRSGSLAEEELIDALAGVELLGIRSNTKVTGAVFDACPDLRAVGCFCIGTNQVDLDAATRQAVPVFNAPYSNSRSVVELVIGEIIALARRIPAKTELMHAGIWDKSAAGSHEVRGRWLGIVGYGNIGTQLANVAEAFGMRVAFYDIADRPVHGNVVRRHSLEELLETSDVISIHVDGRPGNAGLFGEEQFASMKPGAMFINASRGMVVDAHALRAHLATGRLGGAALDVFPVEPKAQGDTFESVLRGLDNVILTPHVGASTLEAQKEIGWFVARKLHGFAAHGATGLSVNFPQVQLAESTGDHRLALLHDNVPGVVAALNDAISAQGSNLSAQSLATRGQLGYVLSDIDGHLDENLLGKIAAIPGARRVHVLP
jgi:D-3-phosphoglycerate dehydrogenase